MSSTDIFILEYRIYLLNFKIVIKNLYNYLIFTNRKAINSQENHKPQFVRGFNSKLILDEVYFNIK
jgi:hypothetical protein